jgi:hypothetical protein
MPFPTYEAYSNAVQRKARHHEDVQLRAYYLWERAGRPQGMRTAEESWQDHFWNMAEREVVVSEGWDVALRCTSSPC